MDGRRRRRAWICAALGVIVLAGGVLVTKGRDPAPTHNPPATSVVGHEVVRTENVIYATDTSPVWGSDVGLHQVRVVAGTLTITGGNGESVRYGPGAGYVAGWTQYVARNDIAEPVEVFVSYLRATQASHGPDQLAPNDGP